MHIPNVDSVNRNVVIVGEAAGAQAAQKYIQKIMDQAVKDKEEVSFCPGRGFFFSRQH